MLMIKVGKTDIYYEIDNMTIGRTPSKANMYDNGSDNSLYLGMKSNEGICNMLCKMFNYSSIDEFSGKQYNMKSYGGIEVLVTTNISGSGQLQIKFNKNRIMLEIYNEFLLDSMEDIKLDEIIMVVDFKKNNIRIKKISDFRL